MPTAFTWLPRRQQPARYDGDHPEENAAVKILPKCKPGEQRGLDTFQIE
jgi:hypothetical protein